MNRELTPRRTILDRQQMRRVIRRMAGELVELNRGVDQLLLVGIVTRGVPLAEALAAEIERMEGHSVPLGRLDITLYRDDLSTVGPQPLVKASHLPVAIDGWTIVLCDDVLYTGRTVRAALDHLVDYGRPRTVQFAVLVDRPGHRELPIQADVVGERVPTDADEVVEVQFRSTDGEDRVRVLERSARPAAERLPRQAAGEEEE
ncbi:MAG TPA: bifunctional pyr operon transcriptional regulator/uracil phosphoribosyltransferase PyrR [Thermoanaerobaculia bacterium]|nr:bifunctional pyr operon transcriptional regulator/uracil phosphoribosyltransferase PyrR [Thermoanaerobaculia bacterium]